MKQAIFEEKHQQFWLDFESLVTDFEKSRTKQQTSVQDRYEFPRLYRRICNHYAVAKQRHYSSILVQRLHTLVLKGHEHLYRHKTIWIWRVIEFVAHSFPAMVRKHHKIFWLATALFYLPAIGMGAACYIDSEIIYSILDADSVANMEYMYDPGNKNLGRSEERQADTDIYMFGFYIFNNISVGFRTFAGGILLGIGSLFILLFNGLVIGGVSGHLTQLGFTETFWSFVSGHGSFELTAIVICGTAGLLIAKPIIAPGAQKRIDALKIAAKDSVQLVLGAALMLVVAAFIEAFWSPSSFVSAQFKYVVAGFLWLSVFLYLIFAGRGSNAN